MNLLKKEDNNKSQNALTIKIPKEDKSSARFQVEADECVCYETTLDNIGDLIDNLVSNLDVCDKKNRIYGKAEVMDPNLSLPANAGGGGFDPLANPEAWWDTGLRYIFDWLKEKWTEYLCTEAKKLIRQGEITFFSWKEFNGKVSMDAAACSLALMLKPWTPTDTIVCSREVIPKGLKERMDESNSELTSMERSIQGTICQLETQSTTFTCTNPPLSEILSSTAKLMGVLLFLREKEDEIFNNYRKESRRVAVVAVDSLCIIQNHILDESLCKIAHLVDIHRQYKEELDSSFRDPILQLKKQKESFRTIWRQIKKKYDAFLVKEGLIKEDEAASDAMEVIFFAQNNSDDFGIESIKLLKNYVEHMKKIPYSTSIGSMTRKKRREVCDDKNTNPMKELHNIYENNVNKLEDLDRDITDMKRKQGKEDKPASEEDLKKIKKMEDLRSELTITIQKNMQMLKNCSEYPDEHNQWLESLDRLQTGLQTAMCEWDKIYASKHRKECQLEEEMRTYLNYLMDNTFKIHSEYSSKEMEIWKNKQMELKKKKEEDMRTISMQRYVTLEQLKENERKLVHYSSTSSDHIRCINDFKRLLGLLSSIRENIVNLEEFKESYHDLVFLWNVAYSNEQAKQIE